MKYSWKKWAGMLEMIWLTFETKVCVILGINLIWTRNIWNLHFFYLMFGVLRVKGETLFYISSNICIFA